MLRVRMAGAAQALPFLLRHEAVNSVALGLLGAAHRGEDEGVLDLAAVLDEDGAVVAVDLRTPANHLLSPAEAPEAVDLLAAAAARGCPDLPGWVGPTAEAVRFGEALRRAGGPPGCLAMRLRVHQLEAVAPAERAAGALVRARTAHRTLLIGWNEAFHRDTGATSPRDPATAVDRDIALGHCLLWQAPGGALVSMSAFGGATPDGIRIRKVYTPPEHRGHGYATACVAALSARLLAAGHRFCFLFTDRDNPTPNAIYRRIGYVPVADMERYRRPR